MKNTKYLKWLLWVVFVISAISFTQPVAANTIQLAPTPGAVPDFRYPVSYEAGEGIDYSVESYAHEGADAFAIDFVYPVEGMDIYPSLAGRVVYADCNAVDYGCVVAIRTWDDAKWDKKYYAVYAHLQPESITVKVDDLVDGTVPIGKMGMSGRGGNNVVHLHFAVRSSDEVYDGTTALYGQVDKDNVITPAFNVRPYLR
jgi:murein DD-endopeptidase MepM/ murein hydrolase activator NlpD